MDIYSIGLKVDSRQVKTAQKDLGGMGRQAKQTGSSVQKFGNNVDKSTRSIGGMGKGLELAKRALGGFAAALSIRQLQAFTQASLDAAQTIDRQARSLSMSAEEFQRISFAFRQFGADSSDISDAFNTLSDRAQDAKDGMQSFIDDFKLVGIEVDDLKGKDPGELFRLFAEGVSNVEDPTQRAAGVVRILGDDVGRRLLPMLMDGTEGLDALGKQANIASDEVIESSARIQTDLTQLGTELETGLQNVFLGAAVSNEEQIRSLVATTLRGMATIADFGDEVSGPLGAGLIGRVLFGKKGAIIGTLLTSAVQTVNALIDRVNETSGQAIVRLQERAESLEQTISGLPEIHPVRQAAEADLERVQTKLDDLNAQRMDSIEIENQYQKALENTGDVGEEIGDVLRGAADAFEAGGTSADQSARSTLNFGEENEDAAQKVNKLSDALSELLNPTSFKALTGLEVPPEIDEIPENFAQKFEEELEGIGQSLADAMLEGDWEGVGQSIGDLVGSELSDKFSESIGKSLGEELGQGIGQSIGTVVGTAVGGTVGAVVGQAAGSLLDDLFGGSEYDLEAVQARQNTGTVLGSIDQKSSSIDNSLQEIQGATDELVNINTGMLRSLQQVQNGIARASARVAGQQPGTGISAPAGASQGEQALGGITAASFGTFAAASVGAFGAAGANAAGAILGAFNPIVAAVVAIDALFDGPISNIFEEIAGFVDELTFGLFSSIGSAVFGGDTSVVDRGVQIIGGEIGARLDETLIRAFARIKEEGGFFSSDDYFDKFVGVPEEVNQQFQLVLGEIVDSVRQGAEALGVLPQNIQQRLDDFVLKTRTISLKGLDAEEQQEEIQAAFSAIFDRLAGAVVPFAKDFQNAGEGIGETIARLATEVAVFEELALSLGESIESLSGRTRTSAATGLAARLGGTENFAQAIATLEDNFFTEAEQFEANSRRLKEALDDIPLPDTREGFLDLIRAQDEATKSGRENIATLLRLQGSADEYYDFLEKESGDQQEREREIQERQKQIAQTRSNLEDEILRSFGRTAALVRQQLAGMTAENAALQIAINLRENVANAQQQVDQAEQNLVRAYEREISTLESRKSVYQDNIDTANDLAETWKGLTETLRESADELLGVGVAEPAASRSSFQQTLTAALGGDREAFEELPQLATDLSEAERSQAGTLAEARRANASIASELDKAADQAEDQYLEQLSEKQIAQRSLDRLNKQINQNNKQIDKLTEQELTLDQAKAAVSKAEATLKSAQDASTQAINKLQELLPDSIVNGLMEPLSPLEQIDASTKAMVNLLGQLKSGFKVDEDGEGVESDTFLQISKIYEDELGRAADVTGLAFYESIAESEGLDEVVDQIGSSAEAAITDAYRDALGRDPDPTGRKFYLEQVESGKSIEQIEKEIAASQESQGFADGGIASGPMSGFQATLHGTEAVIPLNGQRIPLEVNNQEMIQELRDLRQEVSQLRTEQGQSQYQIARNTKRTKDTLEQFDIEGLPPERSEV